MSRSMHPRQDPTRCAMKLPDWPIADRLAWEAALQLGDDLDPGGGASAWTVATQRAVAQAYGRWLTWLAYNDRLDATQDLLARLSRDNVRDFIAALRQLNKSSTVWAYISALHRGVAAMAPKHDWRWLQDVVARLHRSANLSRAPRDRIVSPDELLTLGIALMTEADQPSFGSMRDRAMQFRDGLIMALLATRPIRRRNLVSIRIGEHLLREADGYWLRFRDVETKTRRNPLDMPFPAILVPFLDQYLTVYRPYLCTLILGERYFRQDPSNHLWVSVAHRPMSGDAIYDTITKWTAARLGCRLSPHRFRTCGATTIAIEDPEHVHMIKDILGHTTLRTAEDYYIVANSLKALHGHQARLQKLRNTPPDRARGPAKARAAQLLDAD